MFPDERGMWAVIIAFGLLCAVLGWAVIEALLWVLSHLRIAWA
jgi:hypothetical protein